MRSPCLCILALFATACEPSAGTQEHLGVTENATVAAVGLASIRQRGKLRLLTRNNGTSYFVLHGRPMGFDYELAALFASELGVELDVVVPESWSEVLTELQKGNGDIAGAGMTVTAERQVLVQFTRPYALAHMRAVWRKGTPEIDDIEDLSGKRVHVRRNSGYFNRLEELSGLFVSVGRPPIDIVIEGEGLETEQIIEEVAAGRIPYTLCDKHICLENRAYLPNLVVGPRVSDPTPLAWAVNKDATDLMDAVNSFLTRVRATGEFGTVYRRYYEVEGRKLPRRDAKLTSKQKGKISAHDDWFKAAERQFGFDWRLLAALAYQESHFDAKSSSHQGRGLFGMMPAKARELGFADLADPNAATAAAVNYLSRLQMQFVGVQKEEDRLRLTVAAFECGPEHLTDARMVAAKESSDPDNWGNVAAALQKLARANYAAKAKHGYVRGPAVVRYVDEVWERYRAYRHATGDRDTNK